MDKVELQKLRQIKSELDLQKAIALNKKLRLLIKEGYNEFRDYRKQLVQLIIQYEDKAWGNEDEITNAQIKESDQIEMEIEREEMFYAKRMQFIRHRLKTAGLKQKDLAELLGHSETHMSLLLNGVHQFTTTDLRIIMQFLKLPASILIPPFMPEEVAIKIFETRSKVAKRFVSKLQLNAKDLQYSI